VVHGEASVRERDEIATGDEARRHAGTEEGMEHRPVPEHAALRLPVGGAQEADELV
jgi:hypothetical protein